MFYKIKVAQDLLKIKPIEENNSQESGNNSWMKLSKEESCENVEMKKGETRWL